MSWRKTALAALMLGLCVLPGVLSAATLSTTLVVEATFNPVPNGSNVYTQQQAGFLNDGQPHLYRIGIMTQISGLGANESYGNQQLDLNLTGVTRFTNTNATGSGLTTAPKQTYTGNNPGTGVFNETMNGIPTFKDNADTVSPDLKGLLAAVDNANVGVVFDMDGNPLPASSDPRVGLGVSSAFRLGTVWINWDGVTPGSLDTSNLLFSPLNYATHQYIIPGTTYQPTSLAFTPVPEPASVALLGLGGLAMVGLKLRRRVG